MKKQVRQDILFSLLIAVLLVLAVYLLAGCQVSGFKYIKDGLATPSQLRAASASARKEAELLDELAAQGDDTTSRAFGLIEETAAMIGAPAILTGLLGGAAGFMVPSPGQRKREKVLEEAVKK
tara:strand:+ start:9867 stop:10235 length:369 start_codon:yes stop_codon:yes gene_type:complete